MKDSFGIGIIGAIIVVLGVIFIVARLEIGFITGQIMVYYGLLLVALAILIFIVRKNKKK
ncbi:hypothetical protein ASG38_15265 [Flavobacterium sp. Leaf359]|uniref:hypothetical protein n=1 Tax=Flavobacterium sp. Leaf359 TaxID=1736351 RepID=UPI0006FC1CD1|nr:hypothetical protein [Flavobacterium sp. Leaf359]KQS45965.1 hypothetical protein ASG38_15265 [Flavobacterium sp. Leaf359]